MTSNQLISVIVPVYKVEKHLQKCVDSILSQTYKNLEVILVDDKSPDRSGEIVDNYAKKDSRVTVIHKPENQGLNMARATGFEASTGAYVTFVDSDDIIAHDCIEFALEAMLRNKAEFAKFNLLTFANDSELPAGLESTDELGEEVVVSGRKALYKSRFNNKVIGVSRVTVWGGLYQRESVKKIDWKKSNYRQHEDMYWTMQFLENVNKGVFISRVGYFYRIDTTNDSVLSKSLSGNTFNSKPVGYLEFVHDYSKKLEEYNKKYDLELTDEMHKFVTWLWVDRLSKLSEAAMFNSENNLEYLPPAIDAVIDAYQSTKELASKRTEDVYRLRADIDTLRAERDVMRREINDLRHENGDLKNELRSYLSIKRSTRLLLGNIKRRVRPR